MSEDTDQKFGKWRSLFWPIHGSELKKLLPMVLMLFLICFNYTLLRCIKDSIVVTAAGAAVIPYIKVWVMLPSAVLMTFIFTKLTNRFSQERIFYLVTGSFLALFALFAFIIYPLSNHLHPHSTADFLQGVLPGGFKGLINMFRYWTYTGFYVLAELWGIAVMSVLFWGFANEVTKLEEAKRFYGVIGMGANLSAVAAGLSAQYFSPGNTLNPYLPFGQNPWEQTIMVNVLFVIGSGLLTMILYRYMCRRVLVGADYEAFHQKRLNLKKKKKLSVLESFTYLSQSRYLQCIAVLVVSYNLVINIVEVVWKDQLLELYPNPADFNAYLNYLVVVIGIISTSTSFFMGRIIGLLGWTRTALITPLIMGITTIGFFSFMIFQDHLAAFSLTLTGMSPLALAIFFGAAQNGLSKAAKHSVFDATKEMTFIPLDHETKLKGKAAIDGVGSRLGKSGGSLILQGLLMVCETLTRSAPYVGFIVVGVIAMWMGTTYSLGRRFSSLSNEKPPLPVGDEAEVV